MSVQAPKSTKIGEDSKNNKLNYVCKELHKRLDDPFKLTVLYAHLLEDIHFKTLPNTRLSPAKTLADIAFLEHVASLPVVSHTRNLLCGWIVSESAQALGTEFVQCRELDTINNLLDELQESIQEAKKVAESHFASEEDIYTHCEGVSGRIMKGMVKLRKKLGERSLKCCPVGTCKPRIEDKKAARTPKRKTEASEAKLEETEAGNSSKV